MSTASGIRIVPVRFSAQHPAESIEHAFGINPAAVIAAVRGCRVSLTHP